MRLKPFALLFCLLSLPGLGFAATEKAVYGLNEYAMLFNLGLQVPAKLDTGAKTASLSARDTVAIDRPVSAAMVFRVGRSPSRISCTESSIAQPGNQPCLPLRHLTRVAPVTGQ